MSTVRIGVIGTGNMGADHVPWLPGSPVTEVSRHAPRTTSAVTGLRGPLLIGTADGHQAIVHTTLPGDTPTTATVAGTRATLSPPGPFYQPGDLLHRAAPVPPWRPAPRGAL
ncbi:hypothetical protein [Streptomyces sp. NPDC054783]